MATKRPLPSPTNGSSAASSVLPPPRKKRKKGETVGGPINGLRPGSAADLAAKEHEMSVKGQYVPRTNRELIANTSQLQARPINSFIRRIHAFLIQEKREGGYTMEEIFQHNNIELTGNMFVELQEALRNNLKIQEVNGRFSYKSKYPVNSKEDIVTLVNKTPDGIPVKDLIDSYWGVLEDIKALSEAKGQERRAITISHYDSGDDVLFPFQASLYLPIDDDIREMWKRVQLPKPIDVANELEKLGMRAMEQERKKIPSKRKSDKGQRKMGKRRYKLTNTHMANPNDFGDDSKDGLLD